MASEYRAGLKDGLAIGVGYFSVSFTFGILAVNGGLSALTAGLISLTNLTSAGQFAGLTVILAHGSLFELALTQLVINLRYALMSLSLSQRLGPAFTTRRRMVVAFANTDEIFAVAMGRSAALTPAYMYGLATLPILGWTGGTLTGAVASGVLSAAVVVSCVLAWSPLSRFISSGFAIIVSTLAAAGVGAWLFPLHLKSGGPAPQTESEVSAL